MDHNLRILISRLFFTTATVVSLACAVSVAPGGSDAAGSQVVRGKAASAPDASAYMSKVKRVVAKHLSSRPGYESGFLISKSDVAPVFAALKKAKWNAAELDQAFEAILGDSHFLVAQMRTPQGVKFMREARKFQMNFDRMDRVSQVTGGKEAIANTISLDDGPSFWNPAAKPGFSNTARMLPTRGGRRRSASEFSKPTGKIYTETQLIKRLSAIYDARQKQGPASGRVTAPGGPTQ